MKKLNIKNASFLMSIVAMGAFMSCDKNDDLSIVPEKGTSQVAEEPSFKWDEVYRYNFKSKDDIPVDIPEYQNGTRASTMQIGEEKIYPSQNIVLTQFLQSGRWNEVACKKNPHALIFNFYPIPYIEEISNPRGMLSYTMALQRAMKSEEWATSSKSQTAGSAEASFVDVKSAYEFERSFGANLSVGKYFSANMSYSKNSKKYKTVFVARFKATNFDVLTYVDDKITNDQLVWSSQSYVSSLTFGKVAYLVVYSNYSYDEVKTSINAAFSAGIVSGGGRYSSRTLNILSQSESYAWVNGNNVTDSFYGNNAAFLDKLFKPIYNKNTIGVPVYFQLSKTDTNRLVDSDRDNSSWIENPIRYISL
jgi:hypothetical protein